jgi:hypothetical protein
VRIYLYTKFLFILVSNFFFFFLLNKNPPKKPIIINIYSDLGYGVFPIPQIFEALKAAWAIPLSHGAKVLAMTIPECAAVSERLDKKRDELNALILGHQTENLYVFVPVCTFLSCLPPTVFFLLVFCFIFIFQLSSEKEEGQS